MTDQVILADPPWRYAAATASPRRRFENHYPTMELEDIKTLALPVADNAVLVMWTTAPKVTEAAEVVDAWGFTYRTCMVWDKGGMGMGHWARINHELIFIAARGNATTPAPALRLPSVLRIPKTYHSAKPSIIYEWIESAWPDAEWLEVFARGVRPGWTGWGNAATNPDFAHQQ